MIQIAALVLPDTFMTSLAPMLDAFQLMQERRARTIGPDDARLPDARLELVSPDGRDSALGHGPRLRIDGAIGGNAAYDFIWIPAFRAHGEDALRQRLADSRPTLAWLAAAAERGALIGASGAAVSLPLAARLTGDRPVPVAAPLLPLMRGLFPRFRHGPDLAMADYPALLLSRGPSHDVQAITAAFGRVFSPETGRWIRSVFGADTSQDEALRAGEARDPLVAAARLMLEQRFATPVSVSALATELCVSHAVLIRRFRRVLGLTPLRYVQHLRLSAAKRMLLHSDRSVDSIAGAVGYGDARLFRQMFRQTTGTSATEWRRAERDLAAANRGGITDT